MTSFYVKKPNPVDSTLHLVTTEVRPVDSHTEVEVDNTFITMGEFVPGLLRLGRFDEVYRTIGEKLGWSPESQQLAALKIDMMAIKEATS